jgi:hypothetical protein
MGKMLIWRGTGDPYPGWPASDHEEPDAVLYEQKLASGLYRTPDDDEAELLKLEAKARKAQANAAAVRVAKEQKEQAEAAEKLAAELKADRQANYQARLANVRRTLKEAEGEVGHGAN